MTAMAESAAQRSHNEIVADINARGYRVMDLHQRHNGSGWHAQIGPWGTQTTGFDRVFGRGATLEVALEEAWELAQKLLPVVTKMAEGPAAQVVDEPAADDRTEILATSLDDLLG